MIAVRPGPNGPDASCETAVPIVARETSFVVPLGTTAENTSTYLMNTVRRRMG